MRFTIWAFYDGNSKPHMVGTAREFDSALTQAESFFDEGAAAVVSVHDGELNEVVMTLHYGKAQAHKVLSEAGGTA